MERVIWRGWNGLWGGWNRRWAWLTYIGDGWYEVRWRGGDWTDRDGRLRLRDSVAAVDALDKLLTAEVIGTWREVPIRAAELGATSGDPQTGSPTG